jgi:hypothetical protein
LSVDDPVVGDWPAGDLAIASFVAGCRLPPLQPSGDWLWRLTFSRLAFAGMSFGAATSRRQFQETRDRWHNMGIR